MNNEKINQALLNLSKLRFKENKTDYQYGLGNMAEIVLKITTAHKNSFEYKDAYNSLLEMGRNAEILNKK
jgi:hypothetical protein